MFVPLTTLTAGVLIYSMWRYRAKWI